MTAASPQVAHDVLQETRTSTLRTEHGHVRILTYDIIMNARTRSSKREKLKYIS